MNTIDPKWQKVMKLMLGEYACVTTELFVPTWPATVLEDAAASPSLECSPALAQALHF